MNTKIKDFFSTKRGSDIALGLLLILAMIVSFLLGRMSKEGENAIIIEGGEVKGVQVNPISYTIDNASQKSSELGTGPIVASKRGSKYYFIWCSGAKTLSEANKIYFDGEDSAQKAGYTLSTSCE